MVEPGYLDLGDGASAAILSGNRLHLQQGPINVVARAWGSDEAVNQAYLRAVGQFPRILPGLVASLADLRSNCSGIASESVRAFCATAHKMFNAVKPYQSDFVTPMAAVAGAVADTLMVVLSEDAAIEKVYVNNGGDIAIYLAPGETLDVGVVPSLRDAIVDAKVSLSSNDRVGGMATSGWDGHSYSMGIADAVTVLAGSAAAADVAATLIANQVDAEHPAVNKKPANCLDGQSDLGDRAITVGVGPLPPEVSQQALNKGAVYARELKSKGLIEAALISLQGSWRMIGEEHWGTRIPTNFQNAAQEQAHVGYRC